KYPPIQYACSRPRRPKERGEGRTVSPLRGDSARAEADRLTAVLESSGALPAPLRQPPSSHFCSLSRDASVSIFPCLASVLTWWGAFPHQWMVLGRGCSHVHGIETERLHADRAAGGDCDYCDPDRPPCAGGPKGPRGCRPRPVPEQP